ncbi:MAG: hypothetical protein ABWY82_03405 [Tardiphaga sp.]
MADGGGEAFDPMDFRIDRLEGDMAEVKADIKALRVDVGLLRADMSYIRGRLDAMPTTIQLLGFVIAIFVASGLTRYFGH